jgi:hypothetical protein
MGTPTEAAIMNAFRAGWECALAKCGKINSSGAKAPLDRKFYVGAKAPTPNVKTVLSRLTKISRDVAWAAEDFAGKRTGHFAIVNNGRAVHEDVGHPF